jgi:siroheme synthase
VTTLGEVATFLAAETPPTPAIVVAGRVVAWRNILDWYKNGLRENAVG